MPLNRRQFHKIFLGTGAANPLVYTAAFDQSERPLLMACAIGDVTASGAMIWTRASRPCHLWINLSTDAGLHPLTHRFYAGIAEEDNDFNIKYWMDELNPSTKWYFRIEAETLEKDGLHSQPLYGEFQTADREKIQDICFCWSGDTAGQGWGVPPFNNPEDNPNQGMKTYAAMLKHQPQFFVHSGDQIYADVPVKESVELDNGQIWRNLVTSAKSKVAESVQDFRENFYYNYLDHHYSNFHARVPIYYQWDDHEVINNWYPGEIREDPRYQQNHISTLAKNSRQALFECNPIRPHPEDPQRIYRKIDRGPLLDLFFLDMRSYRGPNSLNRQASQTSATDFLGVDQINWLKQELKKSNSLWKIICADMPLGIIITDWGTEIAENASNSDDGLPLGRELEIAGLLKFIRDENIRNLHFITADVHYCASNHYQPERASFKEMQPFWEHISGPLHAGSFAPGEMDQTFGPEQIFCGVPEDLKANRPPSEPYQFFGKVEINSLTGDMGVSHYNADNELLWSRNFKPIQD